MLRDRGRVDPFGTPTDYSSEILSKTRRRVSAGAVRYGIAVLVILGLLLFVAWPDEDSEAVPTGESPKLHFRANRAIIPGALSINYLSHLAFANVLHHIQKAFSEAYDIIFLEDDGAALLEEKLQVKIEYILTHLDKVNDALCRCSMLTERERRSSKRIGSTPTWRTAPFSLRLTRLQGKI